MTVSLSLSPSLSTFSSATTAVLLTEAFEWHDTSMYRENEWCVVHTWEVEGSLAEGLNRELVEATRALREEDPNGVVS